MSWNLHTFSYFHCSPEVMLICGANTPLWWSWKSHAEIIKNKAAKLKNQSFQDPFQSKLGHCGMWTRDQTFAKRPLLLFLWTLVWLFYFSLERATSSHTQGLIPGSEVSDHFLWCSGYLSTICASGVEPRFNCHLLDKCLLLCYCFNPYKMLEIDKCIFIYLCLILLTTMSLFYWCSN